MIYTELFVTKERDFMHNFNFEQGK